jgi:hypothetical protein
MTKPEDLKQHDVHMDRERKTTERLRQAQKTGSVPRAAQPQPDARKAARAAHVAAPPSACGGAPVAPSPIDVCQQKTQSFFDAHKHAAACLTEADYARVCPPLERSSDLMLHCLYIALVAMALLLGYTVGKKG